MQPNSSQPPVAPPKTPNPTMTEMNPDAPFLAEAYPEIADDPNERLFADVRKHWIGKFAIWLTTIVVLILLIALAVSMPTLAKLGEFELSWQMQSVMMILLFIVGLLVLVGSAIALWVYTHSHILITDENVIEVRQNSLFSRKVSHLNMINVEDVTVLKNGILQTILNYGTLQIQTAGERDNFNFTLTPTPDEYRRYIIRAHEIAIEKVGEMGTVQRTEIAHNNL